MVYIEEDDNEEITDWERTTRDGNTGIVVKTIQTKDTILDAKYRRSEYWFPLHSTPNYTKSEQIVDVSEITITSAPGTDKESVYGHHAEIGIPQHVIEKFEEVTDSDTSIYL